MNEWLTEIQKMEKDQSLLFKLIIGKNEFNVNQLKMKIEATPVTKPTKRGGVYFSDTTICKISVTVNDLEINKYLSKAMLGPNTEFQDIILQAKNKKNNEDVDFRIITNLTSSKQSSKEIELHLIVQNIIKK
tara:strand:+ start:3270 stop:3665 length:396 start_codon:yes stop_codon:yes gene_type:complete